MRISLVPAILQKDPHVARAMVGALRECAQEVQIDVIDGKFAEATTCQAKDFSKNDFADMSLEVDAMVQDGEVCAREWMRLGATRIVLHCESRPSARVIQELIAAGVTPVISKNCTTPLSACEPYLHLVPAIQFMTVVVGAQGQLFQEKVVQDIVAFRKKYPIHDIAVDGGITAERIPQLISIGVSRFAIGSALGKDPKGMCTRLRMLNKSAQT